MVLICTLVYTHKQWSQVKNMAIYLYLATLVSKNSQMCNIYIPNFIYKLPVQGTKGSSLISGMQTHSHTSVCLKRNTAKFNVSQEILQFTEKGSKASWNWQHCPKLQQKLKATNSTGSENLYDFQSFNAGALP